LEKRISRLSERIQDLQRRVRQIADRIDTDEHRDEDA
jgi:hypothetical protein